MISYIIVAAALLAGQGEKTGPAPRPTDPPFPVKPVDPPALPIKPPFPIDPPTVPIDKGWKENKSGDKWTTRLDKKTGRLYVEGVTTIKKGYRALLLRGRPRPGETTLVLNLVLDELDTGDKKLEGTKRYAATFFLNEYKPGTYKQVAIIYPDGSRKYFPVKEGE